MGLESLAVIGIPAGVALTIPFYNAVRDILYTGDFYIGSIDLLRIKGFYVKSGLCEMLDIIGKPVSYERVKLLRMFSDDFNPSASVNLLDSHGLPQDVVTAYSNILHAPNKRGREDDKQVIREYVTEGA